MDKVKQNFKEDIKVLQTINKEMSVVRQLLELHSQMTDKNKPKILAQMIEMARTAPSAERNPFEWQVEWMIDQAYNNDLPNQSSGSWRTALCDIDSIAQSILDDEHERYEDHYSMLETAYKKIIAPIF